MAHELIKEKPNLKKVKFLAEQLKMEFSEDRINDLRNEVLEKLETPFLAKTNHSEFN